MLQEKIKEKIEFYFYFKKKAFFGLGEAAAYAARPRHSPWYQGLCCSPIRI
jgi:hypothetical protein